VETDVPAARANGGGHPVLIDRISLACSCSGNFSAKQTYVGSGNAQIVAQRQRVSCEGKALLLVGDQVTIACSGTATDTASDTPGPANASVTVTITDAGQTTVFAHEA
jgi:hypothetical protein